MTQFFEWIVAWFMFITAYSAIWGQFIKGILFNIPGVRDDRILRTKRIIKEKE